MTVLPLWSEHTARVVQRPVERPSPSGRVRAYDDVVVEEPLEIRVGGESVVVTMRTPGDDIDLALGFLFTERVLVSMDDLSRIECPETNVVNVIAAAGRGLSAERARRVIRASSSCGLCGKETLEAVRVYVATLDDPTRVSFATLVGLGATLRAAQPVFDATGGLHAVGLFKPDGSLVAAREDVGRHNAVDKVIGAMLRAGMSSLAGHVLLFSGRAGFEIVQKAAVARVPLVCAVSAPSSLAVDLARDVGMTLVGFMRGSSANFYTHPWRVCD